MATFFDRINNSSLLGIIFAGVIFLFVAGCWYWIFFRNGALLWRDSIVNYYKKFGVDLKSISFLFNPIILKFFITIALAVSMFFFYIVIIT